MNASEIPDAIGRLVVINPFRNLGSRSDLRKTIGNQWCRLVRQCKNGLLQIEHAGKFYRIPARNVDLVYRIK